jgi:hypothetical protein
MSPICPGILFCIRQFKRPYGFGYCLKGAFRIGKLAFRSSWGIALQLMVTSAWSPFAVIVNGLGDESFSAPLPKIKPWNWWAPLGPVKYAFRPSCRPHVIEIKGVFQLVLNRLFSLIKRLCSMALSRPESL